MGVLWLVFLFAALSWCLKVVICDYCQHWIRGKASLCDIHFQLSQYSFPRLRISLTSYQCSFLNRRILCAGKENSLETHVYVLNTRGYFKSTLALPLPLESSRSVES